MVLTQVAGGRRVAGDHNTVVLVRAPPDDSRRPSARALRVLPTTAPAHGPGDKAGSNTNDGAFDLLPARFQVKPPTTTAVTAPIVGYTLSPASPDGLQGWYRSNVTLTWKVTGTSPALTGCVNQNVPPTRPRR